MQNSKKGLRFLTRTGPRGPFTTLRRERGTKFKRDVIADLLLSGNRFTRMSFLREMGERCPDSSKRDNMQMIGFYLQFLLRLGVVTRVGEEEFKLRESILAVLRREGVDVNG